MTTRILVVNHGPNAVEVLNMSKGAEGPEPGMVAPDMIGKTTPLSPHAEMWEYVYGQQYLVIKEIPQTR